MICPAEYIFQEWVVRSSSCTIAEDVRDIESDSARLRVSEVQDTDMSLDLYIEPLQTSTGRSEPCSTNGNVMLDCESLRCEAGCHVYDRLECEANSQLNNVQACTSLRLTVKTDKNNSVSRNGEREPLQLVYSGRDMPNDILINMEIINIVWPVVSTMNMTAIVDHKSFVDGMKAATSYGDQVATISDRLHQWAGPLFLPGMTVNAMVKSAKIAAKVLRINSDARSADILLPAFSKVCPEKRQDHGEVADVRDCGFIDFEVRNPTSNTGTGGASTFSVYYTEECGETYTSFSEYPDVCGDAKLAWENNCAFGSGKSCIRCPEHAACPGGTRAWPEPGWWNANPRSPIVRQCLPPAMERCTGNASCGVGYAGARCNGCLRDSTAWYYMDVSRRCVACPEDNIAATIFQFIGIVILIFAATFGIVYFMRRKHGGSLRRGVYRARDFTIYNIFVLQLIAQQSLNMAPQLPPLFLIVFGKAAIFRLDIKTVVHPDCIGGSPFLMAILVHSFTSLSSLALLLWYAANEGGVGVLQRCGKKFCTGSEEGLASPSPSPSPSSCAKVTALIPFFRRWLLTALILLYAQSCNLVVWVLACDADGKLLGNGMISCDSPSRTPAVFLAICATLLHVVGMPVMTFIVVRQQVLPNFEHSPSLKVPWRPFLGGTYKFRYFWFRHLQMALFGFLAIAKNVMKLTSGTASIIVEATVTSLIFALYGGAIMRLSPYSERHEWKKYIVIGACCVSALIGLASTSALFLGEHVPFVQGLSFIALIAGFALLVGLILSMVIELRGGAKKERRDIQRKMEHLAAQDDNNNKGLWEAFQTEDGYTYYVHQVTGESVWTIPDAEPKKTQAHFGKHDRVISETTGYFVELCAFENPMEVLAHDEAVEDELENIAVALEPSAELVIDSDSESSLSSSADSDEISEEAGGEAEDEDAEFHLSELHDIRNGIQQQIDVDGQAFFDSHETAGQWVEVLMSLFRPLYTLIQKQRRFGGGSRTSG